MVRNLYLQMLQDSSLNYSELLQKFIRITHKLTHANDFLWSNKFRNL